MYDKEIKTGKLTRRKRRVLGTDTPPRKEFSMRLEAVTFERMNTMLQSYQGSRNEYIERLIEFDLAYRERIGPLSTKLDVPPPPGTDS
jgi:hypothetical protein